MGKKALVERLLDREDLDSRKAANRIVVLEAILAEILDEWIEVMEDEAKLAEAEQERLAAIMEVLKQKL